VSLWIEIDGSIGEGGGQILRTALSLSLVTGKPFRIRKIRAGRERPGLLRQHLTAVLAAVEVGGAAVEGASLGSDSLTFTPGAVRSGEYHFTVGTAGSGTLVLQTILPALMLASSPSQVRIEGGTHNPMAPPFHFLECAFVPLLERMGPRVSLQFERFGFYPAGGGSFLAQITPIAKLSPLTLGERGEVISRRVHAIVANLPRHIGQREVDSASASLNWGPETNSIESTRNSPGPGNVLMIEIRTQEVTELFTEFGKLGVSAERVGEQAAREARAYLSSNAVAGEHLTDQLLLPMALAGSGSFTSSKLNRHARTNIEVIESFLPVRFQTLAEDQLVRVCL
jgi:RNA 3'-terminal phosphate cyclase (ATP)